MRIAFLCKRQYMRKDVIVDRYARLYEQPRQLALRGHDVLGLCLSYRDTEERDEFHQAHPGTLRWIGLAPNRRVNTVELSRHSGMDRRNPDCRDANALCHPSMVGSGSEPARTWRSICRNDGGIVNAKALNRVLGLIAYPWRVEAALRCFAPDLLVGASDCPHIVLGDWLARRMGVPFAVDLYDDFESFGLARFPGLRTLYRQAVRKAAVVSCVSEFLAKRVSDDYRAEGKVIALPSTIDRSIFHPKDRSECRELFGLPANAQLVGTAGALGADKGVLALYQAFERLLKDYPGLHLVLAGRVEPSCPPPLGSNVHCLGELPHYQTAELFNALDVGVVYLRDTPYGRASFPQKAYEMVACGLPVAVARVGAMEALFGNTPNSLYESDDAASLAACIEAQLGNPQCADIVIRDWASLAQDMELAYLEAKV